MYASTLNPADKSANITLSGSDMIATAAAGPAVIGVRGTLARSYPSTGQAGEYYFEATVTVADTGPGGPDISFGISTSAGALTGTVGSVAGTYGFRNGNLGQVIAREGTTSIAPAWPGNSALVQGDVIGCALNTATGAVDFYKNGVASTNTLAAAVAATYYPMLGLYLNTETLTFRSGSDVLYLPPGHIPWAADARPNHPAKRSSVARQYPVQHIRL